MRFSSSSLQFLFTATSEAKMSSFRATHSRRNPWQQGFSDRPNRDMNGYARSIEHENYASGQVQGANLWNYGGFQRQHFPQPRLFPQPPPPPFQFQYQQHPYSSYHQPPYQPQPSQQQVPPPFQQSQPFPQRPMHQTPPIQQRHFRPPRPVNQGLTVHQPRQFHPNYNKPPDYRKWEYALSQPPSQCERFVLLSYNILADYLAIKHRRELYWHIPHHILDWERRKSKILFELGLWSPDIMSLQEVDRFQDLEEELKLHGYSGIWKMRTGIPVDGCAIFWRTTRFTLLHEESIEFNKLGLRDNVAQICVLESRNQKSADCNSDALPKSSNNVNRLIVCNIHVLFNPRRGEMKLGQVRALLERAYAVSKLWDDAPVVISGDFNCTPKSSLYNFISEQKLDLKGLARDQISGQLSTETHLQRPFTPTPRHSSLRVETRNNSFQVPDEKKEACLTPENCTPDMHGHNKPNTDGETELVTNNLNQSSILDNEVSDESSKELGNEIIDNMKNEVSSVTGELHFIEVKNDIMKDLSASLTKSENPESAMVEDGPQSCETEEKQADLPRDESTSFPIYDPSSWTPMEIETATGNAECTLVEHPLKLRSTYTEVEDYSGTRDSSREPHVTSYHRKFIGTLDYIWRSEGLQTVKVLDTIPKHALQWTPGFPTPKWGSDHIALVCQLAFTKVGTTDQS